MFFNSGKAWEYARTHQYIVSDISRGNEAEKIKFPPPQLARNPELKTSFFFFLGEEVVVWLFKCPPKAGVFIPGMYRENPDGEIYPRKGDP